MDEPIRVAVWGTGNVGRPAISAVAAHRELALVAVVAHDPAKIGVDAGELARRSPLGLAATNAVERVMADDVDVVVYAVSADLRPDDALDDLERLLRAGKHVVTPSIYPLYHPPSMPQELADRFGAACSAGSASILASGIDPGWAVDILPMLLAGVSADITEIRCRETFNYALYDQPFVVRELVGFGQPMENTPPMVLDYSLQLVWGPILRVLADGLGVEVDEVTTWVDKQPLQRTIEVDGMGEFTEGTIGALRFEVRAMVGGAPLLVLEHVTRIDDECAPEWPQPVWGQGNHEVLITGRPDLRVAIHGEVDGEPGAAGGGNATAANRLVNAIPTVVAGPPGVVHPLDVLPSNPGAQLRY